MSMSETKPWAVLAYQDALRPPDGTHTGWAFLTTYSAELRGVAAAILALAGSERDDSGGTPIQLASAVQNLRGRVHVALQKGRLAPLRSARQKMAVLLDSFICDVAKDERYESWHPKIAIMRFDPQAPEAPSSHWRLWIGSRNLTSSENLELGVVLDQAANGGIEMPGLAEGLAWLATKAGVGFRKLKHELSGLNEVRWQMPTDWKQAAIHIHGHSNSAGLPEAPEDVTELVIISPFIDYSTIRQLSTWTHHDNRTLISTREALQKLAAHSPDVLFGWALCVLLKPDYPEENDANLLDASQEEVDRNDPDEILNWSLHAKLIAACCKKKLVRMWMGSANATSRGWGRNIECVVEIAAHADIWDGLRELVSRAEPVTIESLQSTTEASDDTEERLEAARKLIVASWGICLHHTLGAFCAVAEAPLDPGDDEIVVRIGMPTFPLVLWPKEATAVSLGDIPLAQQTHFAQISLTLSESSVCWLMHCPVEPELGDERDAAVIADALRPKELLQLLANELNDIRSEDEGSEWDAGNRKEPNRTPIISSCDVLTLEDILKYWGRRGTTEFEQVFKRWGGVLRKMRLQDNWALDSDAKQLEALYKVCLQLMGHPGQ